jgi:hypothetical protein
MKKMKMTMLVFTAMTAIALTLGSCGSKENKEAATETPAAEMAINTTNMYVCPMNCEGSASDQPGKCVVCGMDLVENPNYVGTAVTDSATAVTDTAAAVTPEEGHEGHNH